MMRTFVAFVLIIVGLLGAYTYGTTGNAAVLSPTVYRFRLDVAFVFDGQPYTAIGYMECTYRKAWLTSRTHAHRLGTQIYDGYYTETFRDAPSVVLPGGKGAILFQHGGPCPSLPGVRKTYAARSTYNSGDSTPAYYFPDRTDPKVVWILRDRRVNQDAVPGRLVLQYRRFVVVNDPVQVSVAQNVPIAWQWYEEFSAKYRNAMKGGPAFNQTQDAVWYGIHGCVLYEDEWQNEPALVKAATDLTSPTVVTFNQLRSDQPRHCAGRRTPEISLIPSEDYSKVTLDLDRSDLRWATIATPYVSEYRDRFTGRWRPEICIAGQGCTGIRMKTPYWIYLPSRRVFVRLDESRLESYRFPHFALRPGDGL